MLYCTITAGCFKRAKKGTTLFFLKSVTKTDLWAEWGRLEGEGRLSRRKIILGRGEACQGVVRNHGMLAEWEVGDMSGGSGNCWGSLFQVLRLRLHSLVCGEPQIFKSDVLS